MSDVKGLFLKSLAFVTPSTSRTSSNSYRLVFSFVPVISFNHSCLFPFDSQSTTLLLYNTYFFIVYILTTNQTKDKLNNFNINLRGYLSLPFPSLFFSFFSFPIHLKLIFFFVSSIYPILDFRVRKQIERNEQRGSPIITFHICNTRDSRCSSLWWPQV